MALLDVLLLEIVISFQCTHPLVVNPSTFSSQLQTEELLLRSLVDSWKIDMALCILDVSIVELAIIQTGGDAKATDSGPAEAIKG